MVASGTTRGRTNRASHCSATASTPGHSRSGFCPAGWAVCAVVILGPTPPTSRLFPLFLAARGGYPLLGRRPDANRPVRGPGGEGLAGDGQGKDLAGVRETGDRFAAGGVVHPDHAAAVPVAERTYQPLRRRERHRTMVA